MVTSVSETSLAGEESRPYQQDPTQARFGRAAGVLLA